MTLRALITRPEADAAPVAEALRERGFEAVIEPLLAIHALSDAPLDLEGVQALLFTSANGVRVFAERSPERGLPAFAVGEATAETARAAGFDRVESAGGDVQDLARLVRGRLAPADGPLLHAAGSAVAGDLAGLLGDAGFELRRAVLYEAEPAARLTPSVAEALADGAFDFVLFFSSRTAETFVRLVRDPRGAAATGSAVSGESQADRLMAGCARAEALCLSQVVAEAAGGLPWRRVRTAARPDLPAMLELTELAAAETGAATDRGMDRTAERRPPAEPAGARSQSAEAVPWAGPGGPAPARRGGAGPLAALAAALAVLALALVLAEPWWAPWLGPPWTEGETAAPASAGGPGGEPGGAATADRVAAAEQGLSKLSERLDTIDGRLAELADGLTALREAAGEAAAGIALPPEIAALPGRLDALEKRTGELAAAAQRPPGPAPETTAAVQDLRGESERLRGELAALRAQLAEAPQRQERIAAEQAAAARRAQQAALLLAAAELRTALATDRPFAAALTTVRQLAGDGGSGLAAKVEPLLAPLAEKAGSGIPTLSDLQARFPEVVRKVVAAGQAAGLGAAQGPGTEPPGWVDRTLGRLASLVTVRPVGGAVEGNGPAARVARAEARLAEGDLRTAIAELSGLEGAAAGAAAGWLADARARLAADAATAALQTAIVGALAAPAESPAAPADGG